MLTIRNAASAQARAWLKRGIAQRVFVPRKAVIVPDVVKAQVKRTVKERDGGMIERYTLA